MSVERFVACEVLAARRAVGLGMTSPLSLAVKAHQRPVVTLERYAHALPAHQADAAEAVATFVMGQTAE